MKKKVFKRMIAALLAATTVCSFVACGNNASEESKSSSESGEAVSTGANVSSDSSEATEEKIPEWLNPGALPIVSEGTEKTLKIATLLSAEAGTPEDTWFYKYIEEVMNINLEIESFTSDNMKENLTLMFADGDLPDIIISTGYFTAPTLVKYGVKEEQILDLAPYINEENTPNLYSIFQSNPEYKTPFMDADGHVWSLGQIADTNEKGQIDRAFINYDWLEEEGLKVPETLDEFTNVLRVFKKRGDDVYPLAGGQTFLNFGKYILTALGYNTNDNDGLSIALRDGKVVLPAADKEAWPEFLKTMNTFYEEGLMHPDFYTMDRNMIKALASSDKVCFMMQAPFVYTNEFSKWWGAKPLTSSVNDTALWPAANSIKAGSFVVSADCEEPELALAFADWFYEKNDEYMYGNYQLSLNGPFSDQTDILFGLEGRTMDEKTGAITYHDYENQKDSYASKNSYLADKVHLWVSGHLGYVYGSKIGYGHLDSGEDLAAMRNDFANDGEIHFRTAMYDTLVPYVQTGFPYFVYMEPEKTSELADIKIAFTDYVKQETAKFVTGVRPINEEELNAYFAELEKLGVYDYVKAYADFYESMK